MKAHPAAIHLSQRIFGVEMGVVFMAVAGW